jgi:hypothetical protein
MTTPTTPTLDWTPFPGHYPGQERAGVFYASAEYRGVTVSLYERGPAAWFWSFYDDKSSDPDTAVADGTAPTRDAAIREVTGYVDGHVTRHYRRAEIGEVLLPPGEPAPDYRVKLTSVAGGTKWLSVGHREVADIARALAGDPAPGVTAPHFGREDPHHSLMFLGDVAAARRLVAAHGLSTVETVAPGWAYVGILDGHDPDPAWTGGADTAEQAWRYALAAYFHGDDGDGYDPDAFTAALTQHLTDGLPAYYRKVDTHGSSIRPHAHEVSLGEMGV